jgi:hypothetical protein
MSLISAGSISLDSTFKHATNINGVQGYKDSPPLNLETSQLKVKYMCTYIALEIFHLSGFNFHSLPQK